MFLGRISIGKGVYDLPEIDKLLIDRNITDIQWTIIGNGPELQKLRERWHNSNIQYLSPKTNKEILEICKEQDIFVFPTRFEGFPVALLETMSVGVVPVVSALPYGIDELVENNYNGFKIPFERLDLFAEKIAFLIQNRDILFEISKNCRTSVENKFELKKCAWEYHKLFRESNLYPNNKTTPKEVSNIGNRLDKPYFPNFIVNNIRKFMTGFKK